jgi:hypothetical protein
MNERAGAPAWVLVAAGVINVVYSVIYGLWTLFPLAFTAFAEINAMMGGTQGAGESLVGFLVLGAVPLLQLVGFGVTLVMGLVSVAAGFRLNRYRSKGLVWLGALSAMATPVVCGLVNAGSMFNLGALGMGCVTGCLFGNLPTVLTFVVGMVAGILAIVTVNGSAEKFAWNAA